MVNRNALRSVLLPVLLVLGSTFPFPPLSFGAINSETNRIQGLRLLENIQEAITGLAEQVKPSVVSISPIQEVGQSRGAPRQRLPTVPGTGSGVIIDQEGHIVTNNHVVGDATEVEVRLSDKTKFRAQVIGKDQDTDLAVIKISSSRPLPSAKLGDSSKVKVGQWALAVGNPFGLDRTVTLGVVSGIGRENINLSRYENFIQTDASINPGNSGGPLFNLHGEVIGINTAIINFAQGIGFAIPSNMVKEVIPQLLTKGKVVRGWLGVGIQAVTAELGEKFGVEEGSGVLVNEVFESDPAARGGIQPGDIITKVDGKRVDTPNRLSRLIATLSPGDKARIEVIRDRRPLELLVSLSQRKEDQVIASIPASRTEETLGVHVQDLTAELAEKYKINDKEGVLITKVDPGSIAQAEGLRDGDLVKEVNRKDVTSIREFNAAISDIKRGDTILLRILREARAFYVVMRNPTNK